MAETETTSPIVNGTACLIVRFGRPGIKRKLRKEQFEAEDADKALVGASKQIIDSPEYQHIAAYEGSVKHFLRSKALPSHLYRDSTFLLPIKVLKEVDEYIGKAIATWSELVDEFVTVYPTRCAETRKRLGKLASSDDYASTTAIRNAFVFHHEYVTLSTPGTLKQISMAMFEREEERLAERLKSVEGEIVATFRTQFLAVVEGMHAMLSGADKQGKAQRFGGWRIARMQKFIDTFKAEGNVCGDKELTGIMDQASQLLAGVDPKVVKDDAAWRQATSERFAEIAKTLETMTSAKGKRQIDVEDEVL